MHQNRGGEKEKQWCQTRGPLPHALPNNKGTIVTIPTSSWKVLFDDQTILYAPLKNTITFFNNIILIKLSNIPYLTCKEY